MLDKEKQLKEDALVYHSKGRPGKTEVIPTKSCITQNDLSLAYSPGVAYVCTTIAEDPSTVTKYTNRGNLVAVVTNGSAVLGLGNIGPMGAKPVMEGKGVLFKRFAGIDVFDLELNAKTPEEIISFCRLAEPTFGGINLEDIKAPECFIIEKELQNLNIPVFHDDQHGSAIIAAASVISAAELVGKKLENLKVVMNGAGAAGIATIKMLISLGVKKDNIIACDRSRVIYKGRKDGMNPYKDEIAVDTPHRTLADAVKGIDVLMGFSTYGAFTADMVKSLAKDPIIMAMANPVPEITPEEVAEIRNDAIMCTGRSDYPNQVNNVLCFPFIFRGALDVRAKCINDAMKVAAAHALAALAKEPVTDEVKAAYGGKDMSYGRNYIIPTPFDSRILTKVSYAVAKAAVDSGVAQIPLKSYEEYAKELENRMAALNKKLSCGS